MSSVYRVSVLVSVVLATAPAAPRAQDHQHPAGEKLGTVHFETSCSAPAEATFDHAMALLHSFEFGTAIEGFNATIKSDPGCAIAHWGIAMARWSNPFAATIRPPAQLQQGLEEIKLARQAGAKTARERAYIEAAAKLYSDADTLDQRARVVAYEKAMAALAAAYPNDREASIFWALSLTASALPTDKTYANQLKAGAILEKLYPEQPDHPGITHYIIHSYDVPALADRAAAAARRYATIAPAAPHALHMPSHTFTRIGAWQESIDTNILSAEAARKAGSRGEELHATDYMVYAYLQTGQDKTVAAIIAKIPEIASIFDPNAVAGAAPGSAGVFALAAIPARWVLERRDWTGAAKLPEPRPSQFPYTEAMTYFARALGASHTGALEQAKASVDALQAIQDKLVQAKEAYWAEQVAIQHDVAAAFLSLAKKQDAEAVATMTKTAAREDATDKNAVTPGPLAPARELLGEMLLDLKRQDQALKEFQAVLKKEPNRFRAVYGAARAATLSGDRATARTYFAQLLTICARADSPGRPELEEARKATLATQIAAPSSAINIDWTKQNVEILQHYRALVQINSAGGNETKVVEYLKKVLDAEGIPSKTFALDPTRANLVARLKGNGSKKPLLILAHTDVVPVQVEKWPVDPFGAVMKDGYIWGRGSIDDKDKLVAMLTTMILLKRSGVTLDRDVIFLAEAGEEADPTGVGINFMVREHFDEIDAEFAVTEGGTARLENGRVTVVQVGTTEKVPKRARLVATGSAGHGSVPRQDNAVVHLAAAVAKVGTWETPMHLNETTRVYFERLASISPPDKAARYRALLDPLRAKQVQQYLAVNEPSVYSVLRTSVVPTMLKAGVGANVIPSEAEATLDIRALPGEDINEFFDQMTRVIGDPAVKIVPIPATRPEAPASRLDTEMFAALEAVAKRMYPGVTVLPSMSTGASDMAQLRAKGINSYGIGPAVTEEDRLMYGAHSDVERLSEASLYKFVEFAWTAISGVAIKK